MIAEAGVTAEDWVRVFNLLGSVVLCYGSYRGQRWTKTQARITDHAAAPATPMPQPAAPSTAEPDSVPDRDSVNDQEFREAAAQVASQPFFERPAYVLFLIGFAISALAGLLDIYSHGTFARLWVWVR